MILKDATADDLKKIAECHIDAFPESVTSLLGKKFVTRMLQWYLSDSNKFLFWIEMNESCIGYCGGYIRKDSDPYGSATGMSQFGFSEAVSVILRKPWLAFHPEIRSRYSFIYSNLKHKIFQQKKSQQKIATKPHQATEQIPTAGLVVIGVHHTWLKKGIGTLLQQEFERKAISMGAKRLQLSVRKNNEQAIRSYKRNGYHIDSESGPSYVMTKLV